MKVGELRVGNLVYCKTDNGEKVGRICMVQDHLFSADVKDGKSYKNYVGKIWEGMDVVDCVSPIPITEDILLSNGFRKESMGYLQYDDYNDSISIKTDLGYTFIEYANLSFNPEDVTETNYGSSMEFPQNICVHTLQNIWHLLTGKELAIEL